jgi:mannose-1-phosphate guanylyltransferase
MIDLSTWPALVLAAGLATRLRPLSDVRAKAALPVAGEPIISRILRWLGDAGVRRVVLNLHHRPETITRIVGDGADWNVDVRYSWEMPVLGSAGGPRRALPLLEAERFLIINGDTLTNCDLRGVAAQHVETGALATIALVQKAVDRYALVDEAGVVHGFADEKVAGLKPRATGSRRRHVARAFRPADLRWHFIGVQAVEARAFAGVPENQPFETVKQLYPALIAERSGSIRAFQSAAEFLDVGTVADYFDTTVMVAKREGRSLDRGSNTTIDARAVVEHSVLWDRVRVESGAELIDCVVADDVVVPAGARYARCAIVDGPGGLIVSPF